MYTLTINGKIYQSEQDKRLMDVLRNELGLKSVKDGCSEGACGTCTVLIDGKPTKCCVQKLSRVDGKTVQTVEGLTNEEKELYVYAFGQAGAVQCGFCIPGMVICAKALLDQNLNPTRDEIAFALRNNYCRCTGYKKIIDAVELAAEIKRNGGKIPEVPPITGIGGQHIHRIDVREKVLGTGLYTDDMEFPGMLYASAVRAEYPRAIVRGIDTSEAEKVPGIVRIATAADIPGENKIGHIKHDWDTLIPILGYTHYLGDAIALVCGETLEAVEQAKKLVKVDYKVKEPVFSPHEAMKEDAPLVHRGGNVLAHEKLKRGDPDTAIANAKYVVTRHYETPFTEHAFMEPECAIADFDRNENKVTIWSSDQGVYTTQRECALMLGLPAEQVHVVNALVGGGFGGKEDMSVQHHAALMAYLTGRPVKVKLTRAESLLIHPKRHPMSIDCTTACDENGILVGTRVKVVSDTGAYASLGGPVLQRACTHAAGPYNYQSIDIDGTAVYTNNPPAGAFRGFGVTQTCFATECNLNLLAEMAGISPWEIRYRNAIRPGQVLPNGQIAFEGTALAETLEAVKDVFESHPRAGIACAMKNAGVGVGLADWGRCRLTVENGKIHIRAGASCIGQGLGTVLTQIVCETTGEPAENTVYVAAQTNTAPDSGVTSGSRQTLVTGEACRRACLQLVEARGSGTLADLEGQEFQGEYLAKTDPMGADKPNPVSHVAYGYATQVVLLNEDGTLEKVVAAHDVGRAINPNACEGQIEGGVVMSLGYALTERFPLKDGRPTLKLGQLGLFRANKTPDVETILVEKNKPDLACGAVGIGEITSIPTAPAVQGAYYKLDGKFRTSLPLEDTPYTPK